MEDSLLWITSLLSATIRVATPLIFAAFAGMYSERAGVVDIGLEGKILIGAFVAATISYYTNCPWLGLGAAMIAGLLFSCLHGFACITHKGQQVISGVAINILAMGLTAMIAIYLFQQGGSTPQLPTQARFLPISFPGNDWLIHLPFIGPAYKDLLGGHNILVFLSFALVPFTGWVLYKTRFGLRLRAVGENPEAVDTAGISVDWLRYRAIMVTGLLCGASGAYLSTAQGASFVTNMSAGKGFLALAALIFGKWRTVPTLMACFFFAFADALQTRLQGVDIPFIGVIPVQFIQMVPYILTVLLLAGVVGKAVAPKAIGIPYIKER